MSVNWRHIPAISMPTALTQRAVSTAHVMKALKGMGSAVQVQYALYTFIIMYICTYTCAYIHLSLICNSQIFQSVKERLMIVTPMQLAQIRLEVMSVIATLDLLEMELCVQVSDHAVVRYLKCTYL